MTIGIDETFEAIPEDEIGTLTMPHKFLVWIIDEKRFKRHSINENNIDIIFFPATDDRVQKYDIFRHQKNENLMFIRVSFLAKMFEDDITQTCEWIESIQ